MRVTPERDISSLGAMGLAAFCHTDVVSAAQALLFRHRPPLLLHRGIVSFAQALRFCDTGAIFVAALRFCHTGADSAAQAQEWRSKNHTSSGKRLLTG